MFLLEFRDFLVEGSARRGVLDVVGGYLSLFEFIVLGSELIGLCLEVAIVGS